MDNAGHSITHIVQLAPRVTQTYHYHCIYDITFMLNSYDITNHIYQYSAS